MLPGVETLIIRTGAEGSRIWAGVRVGEESRSLAAEEGFKDEGSGDLVDDAAAGGAVLGSMAVAGVVEEGVGVGGSVTFIEEKKRGGWVEMLGEVSSERVGEGLSFCGLRAGFSGGVERETDEDCRRSMAADEAGYGLEIGLERGAVDREQWLCGVTESVGESNADAVVANIEGENAMDGHCFECTSVGGKERKKQSSRLRITIGIEMLRLATTGLSDWRKSNRNRRRRSPMGMTNK